MKAKYLSHTAARALAADHQHLVGQPFDSAHTVQMVVAGPYSRILQWGYLSALLRDKPMPSNPKDRYDALVVAAAPGTPAGFLIQDLRSFLEARGAQCDLARHRKPQLSASIY